MYGNSADDLTKYSYDDNKIELETSDDAAAENWGQEWHIPTGAEWEELCNRCNCIWEWTSMDDTPGIVLQAGKKVILTRQYFFRLPGITVLMP